MVGRGGVVVHMRWWWCCVLAESKAGREVGWKPETKPLWLGLGHAVWNGDGDCGGFDKKPKTELLWLGFGLQWGCRRWRGMLWCSSPPSHANSECGDGGE